MCQMPLPLYLSTSTSLLLSIIIIITVVGAVVDIVILMIFEAPFQEGSE